MHLRSIVFLLLLLLGSCALKEESELVMPASPASLFVEGYLVPGKPIRLSLVHTSTFQEEMALQLVWNAEAELLLPDTAIQLQNIFYKEKGTGKLVNYASPFLMPALLPGDSVRLRIITGDKADTLYATTQPVEQVKITGWSFDGSQIRVSCENGAEPEDRFYSIYLEYEQEGKTKRKAEYYDHSLSGEGALTFRLEVPAGHQPYRVILYRVTPANYRFQRALQQASRANQDPFEPPVVLPTNVWGGQGMFTYSTQDTLIVH